MDTLEILDRNPRRVMAIGAHPDDIELGAGGTLAKWSDQGSELAIVVCTDGAAGSGDRNAKRGEVARRRRAELEASAIELGANQVFALDYPDGGLEESPEFRGALVKVIREHRPDVVLSHDPLARGLFHRDHRIAGRVVMDAVYPYARDPLHYPEQLRRGVAPHRVDQCLLWGSDMPDAIVDITASLEIKARALGKHASQLAGLIGDRDLSAWLREQSELDARAFMFSDGEVFRLLRSPP